MKRRRSKPVRSLWYIELEHQQWADEGEGWCEWTHRVIVRARTRIQALKQASRFADRFKLTSYRILQFKAFKTDRYLDVDGWVRHSPTRSAYERCESFDAEEALDGMFYTLEGTPLEPFAYSELLDFARQRWLAKNPPPSSTQPDPLMGFLREQLGKIHEQKQAKKVVDTLALRVLALSDTSPTKTIHGES